MTENSIAYPRSYHPVLHDKRHDRDKQRNHPKGRHLSYIILLAD